MVVPKREALQRSRPRKRLRPRERLPVTRPRRIETASGRDGHPAQRAVSGTRVPGRNSRRGGDGWFKKAFRWGVATRLASFEPERAFDDWVRSSRAIPRGISSSLADPHAQDRANRWMALRVDGRGHPSRGRFFARDSSSLQQGRARRTRIRKAPRSHGNPCSESDLLQELTARASAERPDGQIVHGGPRVSARSRQPSSNEKCCSLTSCHLSAPGARIGRGHETGAASARILPLSLR